MRGLIISLLVAVAGMLALFGCSRLVPAPLSYAAKTVLVTGSTDGLGRAVALALAAEGGEAVTLTRDFLAWL